MGLRCFSRSPGGGGRLRILLAITLLYFATQILTFRLGIIPADEGFAAITPLRLLQGERPYLDFWWLYGPTGLFLNAGLYKLFGVSLLTLRWAGVAAGYAALLLCWRLAMRCMTPGWSGVAATTALALYRLPTYNYNHMYAAVAGLLALEFACRALESRRVGWWAASGAMIGLLCTFKMNVGVQAGAAVLAFMAIQRAPRSSMWVFVGTTLGLVGTHSILLLAWLGWDSLPAIYAPQFAVAGEKVAAWGLWDNLAAAIPRSLSREGLRQGYYLAMFLLPLFAPVAAWRAARRDKSAAREFIGLLALYSPAVYAQAFIVGDPSGSTGDNSALLITSLLLLAYALYRWQGEAFAHARQKAGGTPLGKCLAPTVIRVVAATVLIAVYAGALVRYAPPGKFDSTLTLNRARGVRVSPAYGQNLESVVRFLQAQVPEGEAIAAVPWAGEMLAFLSGRPLAARDVREFAATAERPQWVAVTNAVDPNADPALLQGILDADYTLAAEFGAFSPVEEPERRSNPQWEDRLAYQVYKCIHHE